MEKSELIMGINMAEEKPPDTHVKEDHKWEPPLTPRGATHKLRRVRWYLLQPPGSKHYIAFENDVKADAVMSIDLCISRVNSDLRF